MKPLPLQPAVRVQPFTGLVIDVDTWATAHDYHRRHQQLHLLSLHGSGIAYGLDVFSTDPPSDTVVVEAGVAIDSMGNVIVVPERQHLSLGESPGMHYVVLDYVESIPPTASGQGDTRARVLEDFRLRVLRSLPESPAIELARILLAGHPAAIVGAANPWAPVANEVDWRFRPRLHARAPREITVGLLAYGPDDGVIGSHLIGFQFLLRELGLANLRTLVLSAGEASIPEVELLYVTGTGELALPDALVKTIGERVSQGTWLFADSCGAGSALLDSLLPVAKSRTEGAARTESLTLASRHVFGTPPPGVNGTEVIWGENVLLSARDYGCAWFGRRNGQPFDREQIRNALEFGVNVAFGASEPVGR